MLACNLTKYELHRQGFVESFSADTLDTQITLDTMKCQNLHENPKPTIY